MAFTLQGFLRFWGCFTVSRLTFSIIVCWSYFANTFYRRDSTQWNMNMLTVIKMIAKSLSCSITLILGIALSTTYAFNMQALNLNNALFQSEECLLFLFDMKSEDTKVRTVSSFNILPCLTRDVLLECPFVFQIWCLLNRWPKVEETNSYWVSAFSLHHWYNLFWWGSIVRLHA